MRIERHYIVGQGWRWIIDDPTTDYLDTRRSYASRRLAREALALQEAMYAAATGEQEREEAP